MAKRRIRKGNISHLSLVKRGANKVRAIFKSDGHFDVPVFVKKQANFEVEGLLTCLVYIPEMEDAHEDIASHEAVKDMAYNFLSNGGHIDVGHDLNNLSKDKARICENFIVQKGDPRFVGMKTEDGKDIDPEGSWGTVIRIFDEEIKKKYTEEDWCGVSMFGMAEFEQVTSNEDRIADKILKGLETRLTKVDEEIDMKPEELKALFQENNQALIKGLAEALKPEPVKKDESKKQEAEVIKFEGDPTNKDDVKKHLDKVRLSKIDFNDPKQLGEYLASLEKTVEVKKEDKADPKKDGKPEDAELVKARAEKKALEEKIAKMEGKSNQPEDKGDKDSAPEMANLTKEQQDNVKNGLRIASLINKRNGFDMAKSA